MMDNNGNGIPDYQEQPSYYAGYNTVNDNPFDRNHNHIDDRYEYRYHKNQQDYQNLYSSGNTHISPQSTPATNRWKTTKIGIGLLVGSVVAGLAVFAMAFPPVFIALAIAGTSVAAIAIGVSYYRKHIGKQQEHNQTKQTAVISPTRQSPNKEGVQKNNSDDFAPSLHKDNYRCKDCRHIPLSRRRDYFKQNNIQFTNNYKYQAAKNANWNNAPQPKKSFEPAK